jgi:hypothetical protein
LKPGVSTLKWLHGQTNQQNKVQLNVNTQKTVLDKSGVRNPFASNATSATAQPQQQSTITTAPSVPPKPAEPVINPPASQQTNNGTYKSNVSITLKPVSEPIASVPQTVSSSTPAPVNGNHAPPSQQLQQQANNQPQYTASNVPVFRNNVTTNGTHSSTPSEAPPTPKPVDRVQKVKSVYYQSKYKYIDGKAAHRSEHITNIRNLSTMWPSECNGFQINSKHAAYLLSSSSGQIGVLEVFRLSQ